MVLWSIWFLFLGMRKNSISLGIVFLVKDCGCSEEGRNARFRLFHRRLGVDACARSPARRPIAQRPGATARLRFPTLGGAIARIGESCPSGLGLEASHQGTVPSGPLARPSKDADGGQKPRPSLGCDASGRPRYQRSRVKVPCRCDAKCGGVSCRGKGAPAGGEREELLKQSSYLSISKNTEFGKIEVDSVAGLAPEILHFPVLGVWASPALAGQIQSQANRPVLAKYDSMSYIAA